MSDIKDNKKKTKNEEQRRQDRKKHRIVNQVLSSIVVLIIIAAAGFGIYKGARALVRVVEEQGEPIENVISENMSASNDMAEESVSDEHVGVIATPEFDEELLGDIEDVTSDDSLSDDEESVENPEARKYVDSLTTEQKVASLFVVTPEAITGANVATMALEGTKNALGEYAVGGIVYSGKNIAGSDEFKEMVHNTKGYYRDIYGINLWTFVQEEGAVNTIAGSKAGVVSEKTAEEIGETGDNANAYAAYVTIGNYLGEYQIDVDLGPVCSHKSVDNSFLGKRTFSADYDIAASMVSRAVDGLMEKDIIACVSAFPGEGGLSNGTDAGVQVTEKSLDEMRDAEFVPFKSAIDAGADMVMMSHITATNASGDEAPCSLSNYMICDVLRAELGFKGIVITDDMSKKAITDKYSSGEAAVMAINAGCDMILNPFDFKEAYNAVITAVNDGTIDAERLDEALMKIYSLKFKE